MAQTRSISIAATPTTVHGYVADPHHLPAWAPAFAAGIRPSGEHWKVTQGETEVDISILADPERRTIDIVSANDRNRGAFLRVLPNGDGSELLMTLFFPPDTPRDAIDAQMATVDAELAAVRHTCQ
jgi:hypothetical protein